MRIRHLVLTSSFAGAEQHVCVLASEQARHGHEVEVWGGDPAAMKARLTAGVQHRKAGHVVSAVRLAHGSDQPDIVHAHMTKGELAGAIMTLGTQVPVVSTRHFAAVRGQSPLGHVARPFLRRRVSAQIAVSEFVATHIDGQSDIVYAGVVTPPAAKQRPRDRVVLVAQRLSPEKLTADALRAFLASGLARQGWELHLAGRGEEQGALMQLARDLDIEPSVRFLGFTDALPLRMSTAGMVLATAPAEPFGLTVVEAMAHATPVVATASAGHLESVGRVAADALFAVGDVASAGQILARLAEDVSGRQEYGAALRDAQLERFTPERQYADTQAVYERVLSG